MQVRTDWTPLQWSADTDEPISMNRDTQTNDLGQPVGWSVDVPALSAPSSEPMQGNYCTLERLDLADTTGLFEAYSTAADHGDWTYLPYGPFPEPESFASFIEKYAAQSDPMFFTVKVNSVAVGLASYLRINPTAGSVEVGHIHFSRAMQGTAAATEAMYLMMRRAFETGYRRYEWKCDALNAPSRSAAQRLGFTHEGIFRQATHYKGRNRDTAWFGIIDADWPGLQAAFDAWLHPSNFDADGKQITSLQTRPA